MFLRDKTVKDALNIEEHNTNNFTVCVTDAQKHFAYHKNATGSQRVYEDFKNTSMRMLHYSGDKDANVPTIGTQKWINAMNWNTTKNWTEYKIEWNNETAGYYQQFEGDLTFATVHNAGHYAPADAAEHVYYLVRNWIFQSDIFNGSKSIEDDMVVEQ